MTSQPDRPDGDGLLPCPFCGKQPIIIEELGSLVHCAHGCGSRASNILIWNTRATSPSSNGAEGAGEHGVECQECGETLFAGDSCTSVHCGLKAAPPQPAPDAMRDGDPGRRCAHGKLFTESCPGCGYVHPRDRSAPVLSPDGAGVPLTDHDEIGRKVLGQPWDIQSAIVTIAAHCVVLKDEYPSGLASDIAGCISQDCMKLALALSPSGAGAAEPVAFDRKEIDVSRFMEVARSRWNFEETEFDVIENVLSDPECVAILSLPSAPVSETPDRAHYLSAIRLRLEQLYDASADNPRLREQLSDEVDWIDAQIEQSPAAPVSGRDAATLEACAQIAKFGAKECTDGDTDWHKGFRYAAHGTALEIESSIRSLSNHKESGTDSLYPKGNEGVGS